MAEHYSKPSRRDEHRKLIFGASYFRPGRQERRPERRNLNARARNANFGENSGSDFLREFFYLLLTKIFVLVGHVLPVDNTLVRKF